MGNVPVIRLFKVAVSTQLFAAPESKQRYLVIVIPNSPGVCFSAEDTQIKLFMQRIS